MRVEWKVAPKEVKSVGQRAAKKVSRMAGLWAN